MNGTSSQSCFCKSTQICFCCSRSAVSSQVARNSSMRGLLAQPFIGSLPSARMAKLAVRMDVRQGAVDQRAVHVVATLVRRGLVAAAPEPAAGIHLLLIEVHAGAPQLLGTGSRQIADFADVGRHDNFLALVAGLRQRPFGGGIVAPAPQHLDADVASEWRAGTEQTN